MSISGVGPEGASCATRPRRQRAGSEIAPPSGCSSPAMSFRSVVLPLPLRPTSAAFWPAETATVARSISIRPWMR